MVTVDAQSYQLSQHDIWHDRIHAILEDNYIRTVHGLLLTYSIKSRASFQKLDRMLEMIKKPKDGIPTVTLPAVIVGHKCCLEWQREVSRTDGELTANLNGFPYLEADIREDDGVADCFRMLVNEIRRLEAKAYEVTPGEAR